MQCCPHLALIGSALLLGACDGDDRPKRPTPVANAVVSVEIGPIINGQNYSVGLPLHPTRHPEGWAIDLPQPTQQAGHIHYVTWAIPKGSLVGKHGISMRFRLETAEGARLIPKDYPNHAAMISLYFQVDDDDWQGPTGRWYSRANILFRPGQDAAGEYVIDAPFTSFWGGVSSTWNNIDTPGVFSKEQAEAARVGFVLGGGAEGKGHGLYATGPVRLVMTSYTIY